MAKCNYTTANFRKRILHTGKAAHIVARFGTEDAVDALEATGRELVVVLLVPGRCSSEHDVIAILSAWRAVSIVLRIVLLLAIKQK